VAKNKRLKQILDGWRSGFSSSVLKDSSVEIEYECCRETDKRYGIIVIVVIIVIIINNEKTIVELN